MLIVGCNDSESVPDSEAAARVLFETMGTEAEIRVLDAGEADVDAAVAETRAFIDDISKRWHPVHGSELGPVNEDLRAGRWTELSQELAELLQRGTEFERKTDGRFNPAAGKLFALWDFSGDEPATEPPDPNALAEWLDAAPSMTDLEWADRDTDTPRIRTDNEFLMLDLGAYAKGWTLQQAAERLDDAGVEVALVRIGGDLYTVGQPTDPEPRLWQFSIQDPETGSAGETIEVEGGKGVFTSGDYERGFEYEGEWYHHILHPKTGYPASGLRSVTVVHEDATLADAAATAMIVAGGPQGIVPLWGGAKGRVHGADKGR